MRCRVIRMTGGFSIGRRNGIPAVDLGAGRTVEDISAAAHRTCARLEDGSLKCWGRAPYGELGYGDTADSGNSLGEMGDCLELRPGWTPIA